MQQSGVSLAERFEAASKFLDSRFRSEDLASSTPPRSPGKFVGLQLDLNGKGQEARRGSPSNRTSQRATRIGTAASPANTATSPTRSGPAMSPRTFNHNTTLAQQAARTHVLNDLAERERARISKKAQLHDSVAEAMEKAEDVAKKLTGLKDRLHDFADDVRRNTELAASHEELLDQIGAAVEYHHSVADEQATALGDLTLALSQQLNTVDELSSVVDRQAEQIEILTRRSEAQASKFNATVTTQASMIANLQTALMSMQRRFDAFVGQQKEQYQTLQLQQDEQLHQWQQQLHLQQLQLTKQHVTQTQQEPRQNAPSTANSEVSSRAALDQVDDEQKRRAQQAKAESAPRQTQGDRRSETEQASGARQASHGSRFGDKIADSSHPPLSRGHHRRQRSRKLGCESCGGRNPDCSRCRGQGRRLHPSPTARGHHRRPSFGIHRLHSDGDNLASGASTATAAKRSFHRRTRSDGPRPPLTSSHGYQPRLPPRHGFSSLRQSARRRTDGGTPVANRFPWVNNLEMRPLAALMSRKGKSLSPSALRKGNGNRNFDSDLVWDGSGVKAGSHHRRGRSETHMTLGGGRAVDLVPN